MKYITSLFSGKTAKATLLLAFFSLLAKVVGLFRDRVLAGQFGASSQMDIYYSAFKVPDLIFNLIVAGAVSAAFIPVFMEHYRSDSDRAWHLARNFMNASLILVSALAFIAFIFSRPLAHFIAPGFNKESIGLLNQILRIMLLSPIIFSIGTVIGSILQATERFIAYSIAPIFYNIGIVCGAWYLAPLFAENGYPAIFGLAWGVVLGALLHLLVQIPTALGIGFKFGKILNIYDSGMRKIFTLTIPRLLGMGASMIQSVTLNIMASFLGAGSIMIYNLTNNLQFVPISVIGISAATAVFPGLSFSAQSEDKQKFNDKLNKSLYQTLVLVGIAAIVGWFLRFWVIRMLFGTGQFTDSDVVIAGDTFGLFLLGIVAQSLISILVRAFYANQDTKTPFLISILVVVLNILLALILAFVMRMGVMGLALSYSIAGNIQLILLYLYLKRRHL